MTAEHHYTFAFLEERGDGLFLRVRVTPGAARSRIVGVHEDSLKVAVTAPPEKGKANTAVCRTLAKALQVSSSQVTVDSGVTSRNKRLAVTGLTRSELESRLRTLDVSKKK